MKCWPDAITIKSERTHFEAFTIIFRKHPQLLIFLLDQEAPQLRSDPKVLLFESRDFSIEEKLLIRVAIDLWNGAAEARIYEIIEYLGDESFENVLEGLRHLRKKFDRLEGDDFCRQLKLDM